MLLHLENSSGQHRFNFRRRSLGRGRRTALAWVAGFALAAAPGCSSNSKPVPQPSSSEIDSNASIHVDAAGITGHVENGRLLASIPVTARGNGSGSLNVSLHSVDDEQSFATAAVDYTLSEGEAATLEASLPLPAGIGGQADLVKFNLAVSAAGQLGIIRSLEYVIPPYEVQLEGPARVSAGKGVSYRVAARDAVTHAPLASQPVAVTLGVDGAEPESHLLTTDETGTATLDVTLAQAGKVALSASSQAFGVGAQVAQQIEVAAPTHRVLLTTDKPIYKPGQTVHLRALALGSSDRRPDAASSVSFEIEDGKGNKVFRKALQTDAYGVASSDFVLGSIVNEGTFKVRVIAGDTTTEKTVQVFQYALPKFKIGVHTDKAWYIAGDTVVADLDARYFFGKPVANAEVTVELGALVTGETIFGRAQSRTLADGTLHLELNLPPVLPGLPINAGNAVAFLRVTATDGAGQSVTEERPLTVASDAVQVALVPEAGKLVPGIENQLDLFLSDPLGAPLPQLAASVTFGGVAHPVVSDRFGHARLVWQPAPGDTGALVDVMNPQLEKAFSFAAQDGAEHLLVRTERAVYDVGDSVDVEIHCDTATAVYVDWLNEGQAVDMRTLTPVDGVARFSLPIDATLLGENRINAYLVQADGNIVRASRTVFARGGSRLQIAMTTDHPQYAPGQPARLNFSVTDETGAPAVAALGVQIVDQAVFAVVDSKPGLLASYFELEDAFAQPSYEIQAPGGDLGSLLLDQTAVRDAPARDAAQVRAAANLAALGDAPVMGIYQASWPATLQASQALLAPYVAARKAKLLPTLESLGTRALRALETKGCKPNEYYCSAIGKPLGDALREQLASAFRGYDFWGNAYGTTPPMFDEAIRLTSAGPDERVGTEDDLTIAVRFDELNLSRALLPAQGNAVATGLAVGGPPSPQAEAGALGPLASAPANSPAAGGASTPRVRQDFPETLYVNPSLITDASGHASISVDMADSITEWRVSALGHTQSGQLGGSVNGVTVFQDFFVDVSFPATLTRGDEVEFPIAVYNYLDTPQSVSLDLQAADWYTPLGDTHLSLDLAAGEVRGVSLPVRVEAVGLQTLTLTGTSAGASDAVARRVKVVPDGKAFPVAFSGALAPGSVTRELTFPAEAIPGSQQLYLNVYPAFLAQAVSGMDSILQVPSGCFEQTTSTTWPNVLVTRYMQETGQITPEIQLKAEALISAGYQRLLTFEHPGGGFSWFGTQDPAPYLSVTAFGLMEFADMNAVHPVDEQMLARTQSWLLAQQGADGAWQGDQSEFFSFQTSALRNTAFVLWALGENGYKGPQTALGLEYIKQHLDSAASSESDDPYTLALVANALVVLGDPAANGVLARLDSSKKADGDKFSWPTTLQTNFYGGGHDADVASTALATYALLRADAYPVTAQGALAYLTAAKDPNGNFGSTQATTWSLKALVLAASRGTDGAVGTLNVNIDGNPFSSVELRADQADVMTTVDMSALASAGSHSIDLSFAGTGRVSYNLVGSHNLPWSALPPEPTGPLGITVSYDQTNLAVDATVHASASVENRTDATTNMILVTLGVPPGFEVRLDDFQQYLDAGVLSKDDFTGKQLILYVSELGAHKVQRFDYTLRATLPVRASDGGAAVSLYYQPDQQSQAPATRLVATAN
jgi:hypothetical protein